MKIDHPKEDQPLSDLEGAAAAAPVYTTPLRWT